MVGFYKHCGVCGLECEYKQIIKCIEIQSKDSSCNNMYDDNKLLRKKKQNENFY